MTPKSIAVPMGLRYYQSGPVTSNTESVWIVLHGYGQLVNYFHRRVAETADEKTVLVFPEGPHRFYLEGHSGKVGASWMTREWREQDIENNVNYLEALANQLKEELKITTAKIGVIGFSQGAATAMQWMFKGQFKPNKLVLWAGTIPPELDYDNYKQTIQTLQPAYVFGNTDQYFNQESIDEIALKFSTLWPNLEMVRYQGGHYLDANVLISLNKQLLHST